MLYTVNNYLGVLGICKLTVSGVINVNAEDRRYMVKKVARNRHALKNPNKRLSNAESHSKDAKPDCQCPKDLEVAGN